MKKMDNSYIKIGRLKQPIAKKIHVKCGDIFINKNHIFHIANCHKKELEQLGISAEEYIAAILNQYNQIRQGTGNSLLLIIYNGALNHVAAIDINYSADNGFWEVRTAEPRRFDSIKGKTILWECCPSPK